MSLANNELFYAMGNQSDDGFFVYSKLKRSFTYYNDGLIDICNTTRHKIDVSPIILLEIVHPEDIAHVIAGYNECLAQQLTKKYEFAVISHNKVGDKVSIIQFFLEKILFQKNTYFYQNCTKTILCKLSTV